MPQAGWARLLARWGTALLRCLPAEMAHDIGMAVLQRRVLEYLPAPTASQKMAGLQVTIPGIGALPHPIGLAAGFDKNCLCPQGFARMGFSFLEAGTVTPMPQEGNPKPRLFRYRSQRALINRMGFNNHGALAVADRIRKLDWSHDRVPLGINLGKNKITPNEEAVSDYKDGYEAFAGLGRYYVINISSPNTPGLRDLASPDFVGLLADQFGPSNLPKIWVKIDPDLPRREFQELVAAIASRGFQGLILSNTHRVAWPEPGGLSGHPLATLSTSRLEWAYEVHRGELPMIASGGILCGSDIVEKVIRGAVGVQIYTALAYGGPYVVAELLEQLAQELKLRGFECLEDAVGTYYA